MTEIQQGKNSNLHQAKREKNDEFYTQLPDIENELKHYKEHFKDKIVFCNCDDPYESNFFKYFMLNFKRLGLKKLVGMGYVTSPIVGAQLPLLEIEGYEDRFNKAYKIEVSQLDEVSDYIGFDMETIKTLVKQNKGSIKVSPLRWSGERSAGDFRSTASISVLKEADIVVTNPPFSLFREYVAQLMEYQKKFLIIWNQNAITYKEIFPLIKENQIWLWCRNGAQNFKVPGDFNKNNVIINEQGEKIAKFWNIARYTNLEHKKRHEELILYKSYDPSEYPKYDNYDAINVNKVADIPYDYEGVMGVPITFLDKYNPDQFEILNSNDYRSNTKTPIKSHGLVKDKDSAISGKPTYARILIRKRQK